MTDLINTEREISRRRFLAMGGAVAAAGTLGSLADPLAALGAPRWPSGRLGARDAVRVNQNQFMPASQFRKWNEALDRIGPFNQRGLRATGSAAHEGYVDELHDDLKRVGVSNVHFEAVGMKRWLTSDWSLELTSGNATGPVKTASYIPYSGRTGKGGVSGQLSLVPAGSTPAPGSLSGKIAVFDVPLTIVPLTFFTALSYPGKQYDPDGELGSDPYKRPYLNGVIPLLEAIEAAGAIGAVGVLDFPANGADGSYFPYDGAIREIPGLYVDRAVGASLKQQAAANATARLTLPAKITQTKSRNLIGFIPGRSEELVTLHCHTDGSNAIEDNGPGAMIAMSQYLARLPRKSLPRTVMILLTTGHFHGGNGSRAFISRHRNDLVKRTKAAVTIEHLGLREWDELPSGKMGPTGRFEPGAIFAPGSPALVDASFTALERGKAAPSGVLRPLNPTAPGGPNGAAWPGEGQYLYAKGEIPTANYITGPTYLLNWGIKTTDKVSYSRVRKEAIAFTDLILRLGRKKASDLRDYSL